MMKYMSKEPYITYMKRRERLSKEGSSKKTYFLVLDIKDADMEFYPGDSLGIIPENDPKIVDLTIQKMKADPNIQIEDPRSKEKLPFRDFLIKKANINKAPMSLVNLLCEDKLSINEKLNLIKSHHLWDLFEKFSNIKIQEQEIASKLLFLIPRLYSISSSKKMYPDEIQLTIAHVTYDLSGIKRNGVCTEFVCHLAEINKTKLAVYVQPSHGFTLTQDKNASIIMVGPGVGIAPYPSFLQERLATKATGKNWLFFGERNRKTDFLYEAFFKDLEEKKFLKLNAVFSRDNDKFTYVQDLIYANKKELFQWLKDGAHLYVCGDAKRMAKDVEATIHKIVMEEGQMDMNAAHQFISKLRDENRYLRDVY